MIDITPRVLVVDDEQENTTLAQDFLTRHGYQVLSALNGHEAILLATANQPDLVLLDVRMPDMDGYETCRRLRARAETQHIPVLFVSALDGSEEKVAGFCSGGNDYIAKPFDESELLARVKAHLHHSLAYRQVHRRLADYENRFGALQPDDEASTEARNAPNADLVARAQAMILAGLSDPLSVEALAREVGTNRQTLNQQFQNQLGLSVHTYRRQQRLRRAKKLLTEAGLSIKSIATEVGYRHAADLSTVFKREFGLSPSQWRAAIQEAEGNADETDQPGSHLDIPRPGI